MGIAEKLNVGIVGAAGRGGSFRVAFEAHETARIHAVCDVREEELDAAAERLGASEKYADYETMLARSELDAVVIGTPMHFHAQQAIEATAPQHPRLERSHSRGLCGGMPRPGTRRYIVKSNLYDGRKLHLHPPQCPDKRTRAGGVCSAMYITEKENISTN